MVNKIIACGRFLASNRTVLCLVRNLKPIKAVGEFFFLFSSVSFIFFSRRLFTRSLYNIPTYLTLLHEILYIKSSLTHTNVPN